MIKNQILHIKIIFRMLIKNITSSKIDFGSIKHLRTIFRNCSELLLKIIIKQDLYLSKFEFYFILITF